MTGRTRCFRLRSQMAASLLAVNATKSRIKNKLFPSDLASTSSRVCGGRFDHLPMAWRGTYMMMFSTPGSNRLATAWRCHQRGSACIAILWLSVDTIRLTDVYATFSDNYCGTLYLIVCQCLASLAQALWLGVSVTRVCTPGSRHNEYFG